MKVSMILYYLYSLFRCSFSYGNDELMPPFSGDCVPIVLITTQEDGDEDESQDDWSEILPVCPLYVFIKSVYMLSIF